MSSVSLGFRLILSSSLHVVQQANIISHWSQYFEACNRPQTKHQCVCHSSSASVCALARRAEQQAAKQLVPTAMPLPVLMSVPMLVSMPVPMPCPCTLVLIPAQPDPGGVPGAGAGSGCPGASPMGEVPPQGTWFVHAGTAPHCEESCSKLV